MQGGQQTLKICKMQILQQFSIYQQLPTHQSCPRHYNVCLNLCHLLSCTCCHLKEEEDEDRRKGTYTRAGLGSVLSSSNTSFLKKGFFTLYLKLFPALHKTMSQLTAFRCELQPTCAKKIRVSFYWEAASGISFKIIVFNFIKINMRSYCSIN